MTATGRNVAGGLLDAALRADDPSSAADPRLPAGVREWLLRLAIAAPRSAGARSFEASLTDVERQCLAHRAAFGSWEQSAEAAALRASGEDPDMVRDFVRGTLTDLVKRAEADGWDMRRTACGPRWQREAAA